MRQGRGKDPRQVCWLKRAIDVVRQRSNGQASVRGTLTSREEVRPMNAITIWVLPLVFTVVR
jgi:hypothetical protein